MANPVRVVLAAAQPLLLAGCGAVLRTRTDIQIVAECDTVAAAISALRRFQPDVFVLDTALCDGDGDAVSLQAWHSSPKTSLIWLTPRGAAPPSHGIVQRLGAALPHDVGGEELVQWVVALAERRRHASRTQEDVTPPASTSPSQPARRPSPLAALTVRERQIALGVANGKRNQEIAEALGITPGTVKLHLHRTFMKLGVRSRLALFRKLMQEAHWRDRSA